MVVVAGQQRLSEIGLIEQPPSGTEHYRSLASKGESFSESSVVTLSGRQAEHPGHLQRIHHTQRLAWALGTRERASCQEPGANSQPARRSSALGSIYSH